MQKSPSIVDIGSISVYHFQQKRCFQIKSGKWYIKQCKQSRVIIKNIESTAEVHIKNEIIIITYKTSKGYFSKMESGYISIHFPINDENLELFQYKLQQNDIKMIEWDQAKESLQKDIKKECGSNIDKEKNVESSSIQKVGYQVGKLFGTINSMIKSTTVQRKTQEITQKVEEIKEEKMNEESKQRWKGFKDKISSINHTISQKMKPASVKISETSAKIGTKFDQSQNTVVKGIRSNNPLKQISGSSSKILSIKAMKTTQAKQRLKMRKSPKRILKAREVQLDRGKYNKDVNLIENYILQYIYQNSYQKQMKLSHKLMILISQYHSYPFFDVLIHVPTGLHYLAPPASLFRLLFLHKGFIFPVHVLERIAFQRVSVNC